MTNPYTTFDNSSAPTRSGQSCNWMAIRPFESISKQVGRYGAIIPAIKRVELFKCNIHDRKIARIANGR